MRENFILATDSYKLGHWNQYPKGTEGVYSYLEARQGAEYPETVFFGLQSILKDLEGRVVGTMDINQAAEIAEVHFGTNKLFNRRGWERITTVHGGKLPVRIKAVPEGTVVPVGNVLMTVENTDPECFWLTNVLESLLLHVWYPTTVASRSYAVKKMLAQKLDASGASLGGLPFMLHDFGYRGVSSNESAAVGAAAHLVNFQGTDTLLGMLLAMQDYDADLATLGFSVPATEHSIMTALGKEGEPQIVSDLVDAHPTGILSVVADSYNIYDFVRRMGEGDLKERILARDGVFVVRPDSITAEDPLPQDLVVTLLSMLADQFGAEENAKGYRVLNPKVRILWGDGLDPLGIEKVVSGAMLHKFSAENLVFGMGGGLLQKVNRDTQRFAFKSSAQKRNGGWHDVYKSPLDYTKTSKKGRLKLVTDEGQFFTVPKDWGDMKDQLQPVFENGEVLNRTTFEEVRQRAAL